MRNVILSTECDSPLLEFLWQWKVSTTALLSKKFYPNRTAKKAYYRLRELEEGQFIKARRHPEKPKYVWVLAKKGFLTIRGRLPELKEEGYQSEHLGHDLLVTAFHLGDFTFEIPQNIELITEQQLRRYQPHSLPAWVPDTELHRPDGYSLVPSPNGKQIFSFEVEINEKSEADYKHAGRFYRHFSQITKVLWLVKTPAIAARIHTRLLEANCDEGKHNFVLCREFFECGWRAIISIGEDHGKTIKNIVGCERGAEGVLTPRQYHLNVQKCTYNSKRSRFYELGDFAN